MVTATDGNTSYVHANTFRTAIIDNEFELARDLLASLSDTQAAHVVARAVTFADEDTQDKILRFLVREEKQDGNATA